MDRRQVPFGSRRHVTRDLLGALVALAAATRYEPHAAARNKKKKRKNKQKGDTVQCPAGETRCPSGFPSACCAAGTTCCNTSRVGCCAA